MIVFPSNWNRDYSTLAHTIEESVVEIDESVLRDVLIETIYNLEANHLAYSGGVDSTILLCLMKQAFNVVHTYTIASVESHKDIHFSRIGSYFYGSNHKEFIVTPNHKASDKFPGDNAVRQLFENVSKVTNKLICGDGVDEFMCGYHKHKDEKFETYLYFLKDLLPGHLIPLDKNSSDTQVFLPYLAPLMINLYIGIPLSEKVDKVSRKKMIVKLANNLGVPKEIIERNKYGFIDAFLTFDK